MVTSIPVDMRASYSEKEDATKTVGFCLREVNMLEEDGGDNGEEGGGAERGRGRGRGRGRKEKEKEEKEEEFNMGPTWNS